ncbi:hypothetical protein LOZ12_004721 [Ophidiomyces ophidiicola]|uniref:Uncharacterized protein n=1 Tax=Ophidiomyces ophidiicola TaxID=1387563 RepID=A0ACB8UR60_9EURO|nr:hypothetical protein LOZ64_005058 [Ophidiomyces ophidiicola]KAI1925784.1 hypothetical protein LOZ60_003942 [Ophidiomyces ophidiicola]KAI1955847.1 hypothetical protein LOZ59_004417 [Ophidiomyces ophidiicola]KAI1969455.1 hypothetical protein LOZ56_004395 [Ophidiomyces ophidiicola]KAI2016324.1 hypothetical protein LOZ49_000018 [Ophidiomyces ophidiicola]
MKLYPPPGTEIKAIGFSEFCEVNNHTFKRKRGTTEWTAVDTMNAPEESPGEPLHWALFVARENQPGQVYEVTGDAEHMTYNSPPDLVQILDSESLKDIYFIASVTEKQAAIVKQIADQEPPPRAASRKEVKENCQGWVLRVLSRLVEKGFVDRAKLEMANQWSSQSKNNNDLTLKLIGGTE